MPTTKKSVISQLQTVSEGAIEKLTSNSAARTAIQSAKELRDRGERLVHGLESIEARLAAIEERLNALESVKPKGAARARSAAKPRAAAKPAARPRAAKAKPDAS
jgi:hypothetical protein